MKEILDIIYLLPVYVGALTVGENTEPIARTLRKKTRRLWRQ